MVLPHDVTSCLLCPLPTGSPMTPASWGVRRMSFGYSSHSHWLSCSRGFPREYPLPLHFTPYTLHLYALHSTPYTGVPTICHVHGGGSPGLPCFRVNPCSSVGGISSPPLVMFCQWSGNILASFLSLPLAVMLSRISPRVSHLYTLHSTPYALHRYSRLLSCF